MDQKDVKGEVPQSVTEKLREAKLELLQISERHAKLVRIKSSITAFGGDIVGRLSSAERRMYDRISAELIDLESLMTYCRADIDCLQQHGMLVSQYVTRQLSIADDILAADIGQEPGEE